jgi:DNA-binding response OmpR family regulator
MKELKYLNTLYISDDFKQSMVIDYLNINCKELHIVHSQIEAKDVFLDKKIDIIFTEYNDINFIKSIREINKKIPIIIASQVVNNLDLIEVVNIELVKYIEIDLNREKLIDALRDCIKTIDSNKSNIVRLDNSYIYDNYNQTLLRNKQIILLSKKEHDFFKLMTIKANNTVSYDEIDTYIWSGEMTQDALRSVVKEVRKKTYKELIKNVSGIGYRFNL